MSNALLRRAQLRELRPLANAVPDNTVSIEPGVYTKSDGSGVVRKGATFSSPPFPVVSNPTKTRYDLLCLDDSGNAVIISGAEVTSPGDPFADSPAFDTTKLAIAVVKVNETTAVAINTSDIYDVREFFNKGALGPQGFQGTQGWQGFQGNQGNQGYQGTNPGPQGPQGPQGPLVSWSIVSSPTVAVPSCGYFADTSGGAFSITLPASPSIGDTVLFTDLARTFSTNNLTVLRNGNQIEATSNDLIIDANGANFKMVYSDGTNGWKVVSVTYTVISP